MIRAEMEDPSQRRRSIKVSRMKCRTANEAIVKSRRQLCTKRFQAAQANPRRKWSVIRDLLHLTQTSEIL